MIGENYRVNYVFCVIFLFAGSCGFFKSDLDEKALLGEWQIVEVCHDKNLPCPSDFWKSDLIFLSEDGSALFPRNAIDIFGRFGDETWSFRANVVQFNSANDFIRGKWEIQEFKRSYFSKHAVLYLSKSSGVCLTLNKLG